MNDMLFNPQAMQQLGSIPLMLAGEGYDWMKQAQGADQATLANIQAQRQRQAEMHSLEMAQKQATLADTQAITRGRQIHNEWAPKINQADLDAKLFKLTQDKSEEEIKAIERDAFKMMTSGDPRKQEIGRAVYERIPSVLEQRKKADQEKELKQMEDATRRRGQDMTAASARYAADQATARSAAGHAGGPRVPRSPRELYSMYQFEANNPDRTPEQRQEMQMLADRELEKIVQEQILKAQAMGAGKPDVAGMTQGSIPTRPMPQASDILPNRQPQPAAQPESTNKGPAKISTQEEYNKLPPGALYVHPDGTVRRKRV